MLKDFCIVYSLRLFNTIQNDFADAIEALVKAKADVNQPNGDGDIPITYALLNGAVNAIKVVILILLTTLYQQSHIDLSIRFSFVKFLLTESVHKYGSAPSFLHICCMI
jgi:ankyrin repeat protein